MEFAIGILVGCGVGFWLGATLTPLGEKERMAFEAGRKRGAEDAREGIRRALGE